MTMQCPKYPQVQGLCIPSWGLFVNPKKWSNSRGSVRRKRGPYRPCRGPLGRGIRQGGPSSRGKLWRAIKIASICFGQAGENIALFCLIGDDVYPYRINYCDGPISNRARHLNRDNAEVARASDRNVENVASSMMTAPLIKSGPCSGKRAHQGHRIDEKRGCIGGRIEANVSDRINLARQRRICDPWKPSFR